MEVVRLAAVVVIARRGLVRIAAATCCDGGVCLRLRTLRLQLMLLLVLRVALGEARVSVGVAGRWECQLLCGCLVVNGRLVVVNGRVHHRCVHKRALNPRW